jgi:hypothetical protein
MCFNERVCAYDDRFKLHVEVIDNTGSTTFVLFDWVVSQAVGRSAQSYLDAMSEVKCKSSTVLVTLILVDSIANTILLSKM